MVVSLLLVSQALSVELFRYRLRKDDGEEIEYVFESGERAGKKSVNKKKAAEIAADWVTRFYHIQAGAIESQEFRAGQIPHWLFCFSDTIEGPMRRMFFVVLLPDGQVVRTENIGAVIGSEAKGCFRQGFLFLSFLNRSAFKMRTARHTEVI